MKVTITIEDLENGDVGVVSDPDQKEMIEMLKEMIKTKKQVPGSVNYAMRMLTAALTKSTEIRTEKLSRKKPKLSMVKAVAGKLTGNKKGPS